MATTTTKQNRALASELTAAGVVARPVGVGEVGVLWNHATQGVVAMLGVDVVRVTLDDGSQAMMASRYADGAHALMDMITGRWVGAPR